jgi:hypothetical protein
VTRREEIKAIRLVMKIIVEGKRRKGRPKKEIDAIKNNTLVCD